MRFDPTSVDRFLLATEVTDVKIGSGKTPADSSVTLHFQMHLQTPSKCDSVPITANSRTAFDAELPIGTVWRTRF